MIVINHLDVYLIPKRLILIEMNKVLNFISYLSLIYLSFISYLSLIYLLFLVQKKRIFLKKDLQKITKTTEIQVWDHCKFYYDCK